MANNWQYAIGAPKFGDDYMRVGTGNPDQYSDNKTTMPQVTQSGNTANDWFNQTAQNQGLIDNSLDFVPFGKAKGLVNKVKPRGRRIQEWSQGAPIDDVYHGTANQIGKIDPSKSGYNVHGIEGFYTTTVKPEANMYARQAKVEGKGNNPNVMMLKGRNRNLLDTKSKDAVISKEKAQELGFGDIFGSHENMNIDDLFLRAIKRGKATQASNTQILRDMGYSGIKTGNHRIYIDPDDLAGQYSKF